jgi:rRNA maturation RNase YbeY
MKIPIQFYYQTDFVLPNEEEQKRKLWLCVEGEQLEVDQLQYIFMSDEQLYAMNVEYLGHDFYTDIITFPLHEEQAPLLADMYLSIDRIKDNAKELHIDWRTELDRVMLHGILHFGGYDDKTEEAQKEMRSKENNYLQQDPKL